MKVACFAGRCGNGTHTYADSLQAAAPEPGLADGAGYLAKFDGPRSVAVHHASGDVVVADTNNHLVRVVNASGFVRRLRPADARADGARAVDPARARADARADDGGARGLRLSPVEEAW